MTAMRRHRQAGQMTIEMLMLIVALLTVSLTLAKTAQSKGWMKSLVSGPWLPMQSMIENGVWTTADSKGIHPHHKDRHGSYEGDDPGGASSGSGDGGLE